MILNSSILIHIRDGEIIGVAKFDGGPKFVNIYYRRIDLVENKNKIHVYIEGEYITTLISRDLYSKSPITNFTISGQPIISYTKEGELLTVDINRLRVFKAFKNLHTLLIKKIILFIIHNYSFIQTYSLYRVPNS